MSFHNLIASVHIFVPLCNHFCSRFVTYIIIPFSALITAAILFFTSWSVSSLNVKLQNKRISEIIDVAELILHDIPIGLTAYQLLESSKTTA